MSTPDPLAAMTPEELIAVITAGLDADEAAAMKTLGVNVRAAMKRGVAGPPRGVEEPGGSGVLDERGIKRVHHTWVDEREHIIRHDPARVLADVQAKRDLMKAALDQKHDVCEDSWYTCSAATEVVDGGGCADDARAGGPCDCGRDDRVRRTLESLARPYLDQETP